MSQSSAADRLTEKAIEAYSRIEDPRTREIVASLVRHLHGFVGDVKITEEEWEFAWDFMARMARCTGSERNEFLLFGDITGMSQLIELVTHERSAKDVGYALLGPFYRANAPERPRGATIVSDGTPGARVTIRGRVYEIGTDKPIEALLDVWEAAGNGFYENQDESQPDYNLRGLFHADAAGSYELVALMPTAYPVPTDGPVGDLLRAAKRHPYRPAHIHFIVAAPGYETLVTQVFIEGDPQIETDVVFTAADNMTGKFEKSGDGYLLHYDFQLKPGISRMPKAPIP